MDRESIYLRQCLDCNCNDCKFLIRRLDVLNEYKQKNRDYYAWSYRIRRKKFWDDAQKAFKNGQIKRYEALLKERTKVSLDTTYKSGLSYGDCTKFNKPISFIANTLQLDTQECFIHRKD